MEEKSIRTKFKEYVFGILSFSAEVEEEKHTQQNYTGNINYPIRNIDSLRKGQQYQLKA